MTTILTELRTRSRTWHRPSAITAATLGFAALACIALMLLDPRRLTGVPIWAKPFKFAVSGAFYFGSWSWLVSLLPKFRRTAGWLTNLIIALFSGEYVIMVVQVLRGQASHFNMTTPLNADLFQAMAYMIFTLWTATLVLTVLLIPSMPPPPPSTEARRATVSSGLEDRATHWAIRTGAVISLIGIALGALMTGPTATQLAQMKATHVSTIVGAHTVGLPDGGPGLPILGWSTAGGDLRIPHFVGIHALQAIPLLAFALGALAARFPRLRDSRVRVRLVLLASAGYAGLVGLVTWQAERGQSIVHPDALTLTAFAGLVTAMALGTVIAVRRPAPARIGVPA